MKDNPLMQILLAVVVFLLGAAMGGMYVKIQYLQGNGNAFLGAAVGKQVIGGGGNENAQAGVAPSAEPTLSVAKVNVTAEDPVKGDPNAKVTVVEFADYQCPFCERFHKEVYKQIMKDYVDTGKVRFVYKNLAFLGKESTDAANAALCAKEQNKFWEYHDYLFDHQSGENQGAFAIDKLKEFAVAVGLEPTQFNSCLDSAKYQAQVDADQAEANKNGFNSTPSTAVGSVPIIGAQPYASFKAAIEAELAKK